MRVEVVEVTPNAENIIEKFGRICYESDRLITSDSKEKFIKSLLKNGHYSVLEHANVNIIVEGVSRSLTHQLVRHRLVSFSQKSQRYCTEHNFEYVVPPSIENDKKAKEVYIEAMKQLRCAYSLLNQNLAINKEDARYVLPNACFTKIGMTLNFRELLHIIDLRVSKKAQWEIRDLFINIWKCMFISFPNVFGLNYFEYWSKDLEYKKEIFNKF